MRPSITGTAAWTAAGHDTASLMDLLDQGGHAFSEVPPYPASGLSQPRCGAIADLPRDAPARTMMEAVARQALASAALTALGPVALIVATSTGDISGPWERWHAAAHAGQPAGEEPTRHGPTAWLAATLGLSGPTATVSSACASGTAALVQALAWLRAGHARQVLVVGVDALSVFVHAGFAGLGALSGDRPHPFQAHRDGLLLGEGAAAMVLEDPDLARSRGAPCRAWLLGGGLSIDGVHMTAPDRTGGGAARSMEAALSDAGLAPADVSGVSLHGTGTPFNDAMEAHALARVFGERLPPVHTVKQAIGHTLGAAGLIEAVVGVTTLERGRLLPPPPAWDPALPGPPPSAADTAPQVILSTSSAFGGMNAAVVLAHPEAALPPAAPRQPTPLTVIHTVGIELDGTEDWRACWPEAPARFFRVDPYTRLGLLALHHLFATTGPPPADATLVLSTTSACRTSDLRHHARILDQGAARAHRVAFAATIPGTPVAEAAILWGLRGPCQVLLGGADSQEASLLGGSLGSRAVVVLRLEVPESGRPMWAEAALLGNSPGPPAGG